MFKKNSQNMQGRASRINSADVKADIDDVNSYLTSKNEQRLIIGARKDVLSKRVKEIKKKHNIREGVQVKKIKGVLAKHPDILEWKKISEEITSLEAELRNLP